MKPGISPIFEDTRREHAARPLTIREIKRLSTGALEIEFHRFAFMSDAIETREDLLTQNSSAKV